jgi:hypothetical protein
MNADRWIALVSLMITIAAILFSIWAYRRGEKRRIPTVVTSAPGKLIEPTLNRIDGFSITHKEKPVAANGISLLSVFFWNDGQLPLQSSEVISPYRVIFPKDVRVLDLALTNTTRSNLGIEAKVVSTDEYDSIMISFSVLEPGDGLKLQVIFDGPPNSEITFSGSCLGSAKLKVLSPDGRYFSDRAKRLAEIFQSSLALLIVAISLLAIFGIFELIGGFVGPSAGHWIGIGFVILLGILTVIGIGATVYDKYKQWTAPSVPPEIRGL